ncbi:MAG: hypothetical protein HFI93_07090 [Lachnospiraceae bacterium]|nr:hypothetical protein [Lachnospiraceae bacterium]
MKKSLRVLSLAAALLLIGLLLAGLAFAFSGAAWSGPAALSCLLAVFVLSVLLYGIGILQKHQKKKDPS